MRAHLCPVGLDRLSNNNHGFHFTCTSETGRLPCSVRLRVNQRAQMCSKQFIILCSLPFHQCVKAGNMNQRDVKERYFSIRFILGFISGRLFCCLVAMLEVLYKQPSTKAEPHPTSKQRFHILAARKYFVDIALTRIQVLFQWGIK